MNLMTGFKWLDALLPEGIPYPSSTIISGPGGAGKPLIGAMLIDAWLKRGGTLIYLLINSGLEYAQSLLQHFEKDIEKHSSQIVYVEFDPQMEGVEKIASNILRANLLKAENLDLAIKEAKIILPESDTGTMIYGNALNILLFSRTYGESIHKKFLSLIKSAENTLFTISNNVNEEQAEEWEDAADNLFFSHGKGIMQLGFKIEKMKEVAFSGKEVDVPLSEDELRSMRSEADKSRKHLIPMIRKI